MRMAIAVIATLSLGLAGCDVPPGGDSNAVGEGDALAERDIPPLKAAQIRIYLGDSTLRNHGEERLWHVYLGPDGLLSGQARHLETGGVESARGRWYVEPDGRICGQWQGDWSGGVQGCAQVFRYGEDYLFVSRAAQGEDVTETRHTRLPGNPQNL